MVNHVICVPLIGLLKDSVHVRDSASLCFRLARFEEPKDLVHAVQALSQFRTVASEEKSFAIGVQFLLMRVLAWLPAPALFGVVIDSSCIWWKHVCGKKYSCGYYDIVALRNRYMGLQVSYKMVGIILLVVLGWKTKRTQEYCLEKGHCDPI